MQYIWQHRLYRNSDMVTNDGLKVRVIDPGLLNTDAGPDFFNAKIEIDGHLWAGNVELHALAPAGQAQRLAAASRGSALRAGGQERPALARAVQHRLGAVERLARATIFHGCPGASAPGQPCSCCGNVQNTVPAHQERACCSMDVSLFMPTFAML